MRPNRAHRKSNIFNPKPSYIRPETLSEKLKTTAQDVEAMEKEMSDLRIENKELRKAAGISLLNQTSGPFDMTKEKIFQELFILKRVISFWVQELPGCNFAKKWRLANDYLKRVGARYLTDTSLSLEKTHVAEKPFLIFATCSLIWKSYFDTTLPGATPQDNAVLEQLQEGMERMSSFKDPKAIRKWRSDTLQAFVFSDAARKGSDEVSATLTRYVRGLFDILAFDDPIKLAISLSGFNNRMGKMAERVAIAIQCSPEDHVWNWSCPFSTIHNDELDKFEIFRLEDEEGSSTKEEKVLPEYDGVVGVTLLSEFLFPSLSRLQDDGDPIVISKGWVAMIPLGGKTEWQVVKVGSS